MEAFKFGHVLRVLSADFVINYFLQFKNNFCFTRKFKIFLEEKTYPDNTFYN